MKRKNDFFTYTFSLFYQIYAFLEHIFLEQVHVPNLALIQ